MAYIGIQPAESFTSFATQTFSVSATTSYTLDNAVANENELALFVNNVRQQPGSGKAYTASGTALTLSAATATTDTMYCIYLGRALQTVVPATNSITADMIGDTAISGKTALASEPADTDEFLVSDAGTLKRIDYSLIKGGGITAATSFRVNAQTNENSSADITANWEVVDTADYSTLGSAVSQSSGIFTFPSTGYWLALCHFYVAMSGDNSANVILKVTTDNSTYTARSFSSAGSSGSQNGVASFNSVIDVTNTTNVKCKFATSSFSAAYLYGETNASTCGVTFIRLTDT